MPVDRLYDHRVIRRNAIEFIEREAARIVRELLLGPPAQRHDPFARARGSQARSEHTQRLLARRNAVEPQFVVLTEAVKLSDGPTRFLPVTITPGSHGERFARPVPLNTSGDLAGLIGTAGFIELPASCRDFVAGTSVQFWPWS